MSKLYFSYAAMNAGKSTLLLQVAHNYRERGMNAYLINAGRDNSGNLGKISSRIGISKESDSFKKDEDLFCKIENKSKAQAISCVLIDEAQWLSEAQVWELSRVVDVLGVPVMCYGLRTDFQGKLFPGSRALLAIADELREVRTVCHCGGKATMTLRLDEKGRALTEGPQNKVGGNESYVSVCRKHWKEALSN